MVNIYLGKSIKIVNTKTSVNIIAAEEGPLTKTCWTYYTEYNLSSGAFYAETTGKVFLHTPYSSI